MKLTFKKLSTGLAANLIILLSLSLAQAEILPLYIPLPSPEIRAKASEYEKIFKLAFKVMRHKELYEQLNQSFKTNLVISNSTALQLSNSNSGSVDSNTQDPQLNSYKRLSMSQIVYILQSVPDYFPLLEKYLAEFQSGVKDTTDEQRAKRKEFQDQFNKIVSSDERLKKTIADNTPDQPLTLRTTDGKPAFSSLRMFVNHPILEKNSKGKLVEKPADDLRALVIKFIKDADQEIVYNVYDFDLQPVAEALVAAHNRGINILGGIDAATVALRPEDQKIVSYLTQNNIPPVLVDSVGLNHQKIIIRDPHGPKAAVLFLSGNLTQSCLGPEGDLINIPAALRPSISIPNANHALLVSGTLPAIVTQQELNKTLVYQIRGESQYPVSGAYQLLGPIDAGTNQPSWIVMTFSPNGGMGDINRDILARLILQTTGPLESVQFAFSSPLVEQAIIERVKRDTLQARQNGQSQTGPASFFKSIGDTPFAMREWSGFLFLSGYIKNLTTNYFEKNPQFPLLPLMTQAEFSQWQLQIRAAPPQYGERTIRLSDGQKVKVTSKIHHKIWNIPRHMISVVGTSFNTSEGAETNNEQLIIVRDSKITAKTSALVNWLYKNSKESLAQVAERRNLAPSIDISEKDSEGRSAEIPKK